jgi:glycosyltransferase involved in cell wall biosynthesis/peptidoglycan/xylan/chitin deacetylase (PgdA/CDA1 family)
MVANAAKETIMIEMSVIIPTYNRAERLRACLEALSRQTQPTTDFEVIVVVDGSTDGTREMLAHLNSPYPLNVIWQENSGQCAARNRGIEAARGRYCLFIDDDIIADPKLVAEHLRVQCVRGGVVGIGQITLTVSPNADWFMRCFAQGWSDHYAQLNQGMQPPSWMDCYSGNMSAPRAVLLAVGGFAVDLPASFGVELAYRLKQRGLSFAYIPDAIGNQDERKGFREIAADAERQGRACGELYHRHPPMLSELLGAFGEEKLRVILLRRLLLALGVSPRLLALIGPLSALPSWTYAWYCFLHSFCYWRGVRRSTDRDTWKRLTHGTPILMYHAFGGPGEPPSRYVIPVRRFARQMAWLKWMGYHVLSLEEFLCYQREYRLPPAQSVVITIDDGYAETLTLAYPILRRYGFPATLFLVSDRVGSTNQWSGDGGLAGRPLLSWSDIQEMLRGGMQVGAHTRTHPTLTAMPTELVQEEVKGSRTDLERELGVPIRVFAYPYGEYDSTVQAVVEQAGFVGSCSVQSGMNSFQTPVHALRRTEIDGTDSLLRFVLNLWLGDAEVVFRRRIR